MGKMDSEPVWVFKKVNSGTFLVYSKGIIRRSIPGNENLAFPF